MGVPWPSAEGEGTWQQYANVPIENLVYPAVLCSSLAAPPCASALIFLVSLPWPSAEGEGTWPQYVNVPLGNLVCPAALCSP